MIEQILLGVIAALLGALVYRAYRPAQHPHHIPATPQLDTPIAVSCDHRAEYEAQEAWVDEYIAKNSERAETEDDRHKQRRAALKEYARQK